MLNGLLRHRVPPLGHLGHPANQARLLSLRTYALVVNNIAGQYGLYAIHHEERCVSGSTVGHGPQPPEYGVELLNPVLV